MPTAITISDPIFSGIAGTVPADFLSDVVNLINRSPSMLTQINQLDATPLAGGGTATIALQQGSGNGGSSSYHSSVINLNIGTPPSYDDSTSIATGGSLTPGQTEDITPAGTFVGLLAYELAHWGDSQLGPLYSGSITSYPLEQAVATEFASEGKAAQSQYTAMTQIQGSEASQKLPSGMANGNILFNVTGVASQDTQILQQVITLAGGSDAYAATVSYLGSQFWDVPVDGGTFLTTIWGGYDEAGAVDDLGIDESHIVGFTVSEAQAGSLAAGTLAGCTIQTEQAGGGGLTYTISCPTPGQQQAQITDTASGAAVASVGSVIDPASGQLQLNVAADAYSFTAPANSVASVQGDGDGISLGSDASLVLSGSGSTVSCDGDNQIALAAATSADVLQGGAGIELNGAASSVSVTGGGSAIGVAGAADSVTASASSITVAASLLASLSGSDDQVTLAAGDRLDLSGGGDSVTASAGTVSLTGGNASLALLGDQNRLFAAGGPLQLTISGNNAQVILAAGSDTISGADASTTVFGAASSVAYQGGGGILVMGSGAATVVGAAHETVFGGAGGVVYRGGQEYADVVASSGSCTIDAGAGGGWYGGGTIGHNVLVATGAGTVLDAGGNGDSLTGAAGGGAYLIAAAGNETLYGGNTRGLTTCFLGSGADLVVAGAGGSIIDTGSGSASIDGGGGHDQIWGGTGAADLFVASNGGVLEIHGFRAGTDHLSAGGQQLRATSQTNGGTLFTLSSGATIMLVGVDAQSGVAFS